MVVSVRVSLCIFCKHSFVIDNHTSDYIETKQTVRTFLSCATSTCLKPDDWQAMLNCRKNWTSRRWRTGTAAVVLWCWQSSCRASSLTYRPHTHTHTHTDHTHTDTQTQQWSYDVDRAAVERQVSPTDNTHTHTHTHTHTQQWSYDVDRAAVEHPVSPTDHTHTQTTHTDTHSSGLMMLTEQL